MVIESISSWNGRLVVEIKAVDRLAPVHEAQVLTYLKLSGLHLGLLINFNVPMLKRGDQEICHGFVEGHIVCKAGRRARRGDAEGTEKNFAISASSPCSLCPMVDLYISPNHTLLLAI